MAFSPGTVHSLEIQSYRTWWGAASPILNDTPVVYTSYKIFSSKSLWLSIILYQMKPFKMAVEISWLTFPLLTLYVLYFKENIKMYLHFISFLHTDTTQVVEIIPCVRQELNYANIMDADVLVTQGARASATVILTMLNRNNLLSAHKGINRMSWGKASVKFQGILEVTKIIPKSKVVWAGHRVDHDLLWSWGMLWVNLHHIG